MNRSRQLNRRESKMPRTVNKIAAAAERAAWLDTCQDQYERAKQALLEAAEEHGARALDVDDTEVNEYDNLGRFEHAAIALALAEEGLRYLYTEDEAEEAATAD